MNIEDKITLYALNALDADEQAAFERELAKSSDLRAKLAEERAVVVMFAQAAEPIAPSPAMRRNLMARVDADLASRQPVPQAKSASLWERILNGWRAFAPTGALVAAALALVMGLWAVNTQRELQQLRGELAAVTQPGALAIAVPAADKQSAARATVFVRPGTNSATLSVANLRAVDAQQTYQAWLIRDGKPIPAGTFNTDAAGVGRLVLNSDVPITGKEQIGVTIERAGGAATPNLQALVFIGPLG